MIRVMRAAGAMAWVCGLAACVMATPAMAQGEKPAQPPEKQPAKQDEALPDVSKTPTLFVVAYAHLDTQWRWTYPQVIREFIANTLNDNFRLMDKYPNYVFNFSGSRRYQMMEEYYPELYARLKKEIAAGKWFPCGSSVDENDANVPSGESYVRHVLYGNRFFRREFGVASEEYMLPDCFGFPAAIPSLLAHCGVKQFSTQKLTWNSVVPIPFKVGVWEGPDGRSVVAALDPGSYGGEVLDNLAHSEGWKNRINANGKTSGVFADYHYYGTGDQGGSPTERSVAMMETSLATKDGIKIVAGPADDLVKAITSEERAKLPTYKGELQLTEHSAGSITSEAYMKRWNRKNELLANDAETASVAAMWLGGREYPAAKLENAWTLVLGSQMHDILPGTSHPRAYDFSWNDEILAGNQFGAVLTDGVGVIASQMDTRGDGTALVVYNPLSVAREDIVEASVPGDVAHAKSVFVTGPTGEPVNAQVIGGDGTHVKIAFHGLAPSAGCAVYHVKLSDAAPATNAKLRVDEHGLENGRYVVKLNERGDVVSIFDKAAKRELLSGPAVLDLCYENPRNWPAWNQDWADRQKPVREVVGATPDAAASVKVIENGPARVALEVTRHLGSSTFVQRIRLSDGAAGDRVEFDCTIDWAQRERSLRAAFPLAIANKVATYDLQDGTLQRGNAHEKQFEYAFQQWFDLTDDKGDYGVTVMSDCKYGSDKPNDDTLRLTLLHTPGTHGGYQDQGSQDIGRHHIVYALAGHEGDWRKELSAVNAARLNQPLMPFVAKAHEGSLGATFSLMQVSDPNVRIAAIKKAEDSDEVIVRLRELSGDAVRGVRVAAGAGIVSAREVDGQERPIGPAKVADGSLETDIGGYELRAFALTLAPAKVKAAKAACEPLTLAFDTDVVASRGKRTDGAMDGAGDAYPAEQFPASVTAEDATFKLGPAADGQKNALSCKGQEIKLPGGDFDRVYLLAASSDGDVDASVEVDGKPVAVRFRDWSGMLGQWDRRLWAGEVPEMAFNWHNDLAGIEPGYVKPEEVAWHVSHYSTPKGDAFYQYCYMYKVAIDVPKGVKSVTLPNDPRVKVFAASVVNTRGEGVTAAAPLFDTLKDHVQDGPRVVFDAAKLSDATPVTVEPRLYWKAGEIRYTLDGSEPTAASMVYDGPIMLSGPATVTAAIIGSDGKMGPSGAAKVEVHDTTAPALKSVEASYGEPTLRLEFSEPVAALTAANLVIEPSIEVKSVSMSKNASAAVVTLGAAPKTDATYRLSVKDLTDLSPAKNKVSTPGVEFAARGPVYSLPEISKEQYGKAIKNVPNLPVKAGDAWTMNMFVRAEKQPPNRTIIAGFGKCEDGDEGVARYMSKFANGVQFWSCNRDVPTEKPLELKAWQMLTATYDGHVLTVYKDGEAIGSRKVALDDDEATVNIAPVDPWEHKRRFEGEIKGFSIWGSCLSPDGVKSLMQGMPK